jgi:type IV pilus assembly protein PilB
MDAGRDDDDDLGRVKEIVEDAPIVKFVNLLITQAIQDRASDIHIEPAERDCGCASASTASCTR